MKFWVGVTDKAWFKFLAARKPDEVNFWKPSGGTFQALQAGEPFFFKLRSPDNFIVGGGFFQHYSSIPISFAWKAFGELNGAESEDDLRKLIVSHLPPGQDPGIDHEIGCILLCEPFFIPEDQWIPTTGRVELYGPGMTYDASSGVGASLWCDVEPWLRTGETAEKVEQPVGFRLTTTRTRLGQGTFRVIVTDQYARTCAVTNSRILHVLDAAHIKPVKKSGTHAPENGILLRQDVHTLFDKGYLTVSPEFRLEVSSRIKSEFDNGKEYYALHGNAIQLPGSELVRPSRKLLSWHNDNVYRG